MTRFPRALSIAMLLILAACTSTTTSSPSAEPTATPEPTPTASASPEPTPSASAAETDSPEASPSSSPDRGCGRLHLGGERRGRRALRSTASTARTWTTATRSTSRPSGTRTPSSAASRPAAGSRRPSTRPGTPASVPDEVAIEIFVIDGPREYLLEIIDEDSGFVGATQPATRVRVAGNDAESLRVRRPARSDTRRGSESGGPDVEPDGRRLTTSIAPSSTG